MKGHGPGPDRVIMLEHKGLYWSKVPGTGSPHGGTGTGYFRLVKAGSLRGRAEKYQGWRQLRGHYYGMGVYWAIYMAAASDWMVGWK